MIRIENIGNTVLCLGDCLEVIPHLDFKVDMVLADPPYGITNNEWDVVIPIGDMWTALRQMTNKNTPIILTSSQPFTSLLVVSNLNEFKYCWVWEKGRATGHLNSKSMPMKSHEDIVVFAGGVITYNPQKTKGKPYKNHPGGSQGGSSYGKFNNVRYGSVDGSRYPRTVQFFSHHVKPVHPTQKPIALIEYLIRTYTNEGDTVLDFAMGSGTTGIACLNTGRKFIGIEIDPDYFNIACERMESANG